MAIVVCGVRRSAARGPDHHGHRDHAARGRAHRDAVSGAVRRLRRGAFDSDDSVRRRFPGSSTIPLIGTGLFDQPVVTYVVYVLIPLTWWWMYRTHAGLALRAVGESPLAAEAAGIRANRVRFAALVFGGVTRRRWPARRSSLAQAGTFAEDMSAGRGFIAIAIVVLGRWHPLGVALAGARVRRGQRAAVPAAGARARRFRISSFSRCPTCSRSPRSRVLPAECARRRRWRESTTRADATQQ